MTLELQTARAARSDAPRLLSRLLIGGGLLALGGVALWLRWAYVTGVSLHVDEYTTLWAAQRTLDAGAPIMPSGVLYTRGVLHSYIIAALASAGGMSAAIGRLPSVIFGLATLLSIFLVGRYGWNTRVAWLAGLAFAVLPEAVEAGGRARFYAPLVFFALLTLWAAYRAVVHDPENGPDAQPDYRRQLMVTVFFALALFSHEEAALLYPVIVLSALLWRGPHFFLSPPVLAAHALSIAVVLARLILEQYGQPDYVEAIQTHKPLISLFGDVPGAWHEYHSLFFSRERLPWTLTAIVAVGAALLGLPRAGWRLSRLPAYHQVTLYFALHYSAVLLMLLTVLKWQEDRYLWMVQPCWMLAGAAGVVWIAERVTRRAEGRWLLAAAFALLALSFLWPRTMGSLTIQPEGYDRAFQYVLDHHQPGDIVMSPQPPACAVMMGRPCDYYARERGYEAYAILDNGVLVDRWTGARVLHTELQLRDLLRQGGRVWFVTDGHRLGERFRDPFIRTTVEQFEVAFQERGVSVLVASGWREPPAYPTAHSFDPPVAIGPLWLTGWERGQFTPGQELHVMLLWQLSDFVPGQFNTSLHLVAADGSHLTQADGPPAGGMISTYDRAGTTLPDPKALVIPSDLAPGRYRLELTAYDTATHTPVAPAFNLAWFRVGPPPAPPDVRLNQAWRDGLALVGHDMLPAHLPAGEELHLRLLWQSMAEPALNYTVFVHLLGPDGGIIAQSDRMPEHGFYPTSDWQAGDLVEDTHRLALPAELPAGTYSLLVGWYDPATGRRLLLSGGRDNLPLQQWEVP